MGQPTLHALFVWTDAGAGNSPTAIARWRPARAGRDPELIEGPSKQRADDETDYCLERAEVEVLRAGEATHPAARDAHMEMAALYCARALAACQPESPRLYPRPAAPRPRSPGDTPTRS
jgi:hypothetical protein